MAKLEKAILINIGNYENVRISASGKSWADVDTVIADQAIKTKFPTLQRRDLPMLMKLLERHSLTSARQYSAAAKLRDAMEARIEDLATFLRDDAGVDALIAETLASPAASPAAKTEPSLARKVPGPEVDKTKPRIGDGDFRDDDIFTPGPGGKGW